MSKRLQVLLEEAELQEIQRASRHRKETVADWVRRQLRRGLDEGARQAPERKLATILKIARESSGPTGDIDEILAQIEKGRALP